MKKRIEARSIPVGHIIGNMGLGVAAVFIGAVLLAETPIDRARALVAAGKTAEAREVLAGLDASSPAVAHLTGILHFNARQYPQAVEDLKRAVAGGPEALSQYGEAMQLLARSLFLSGRMLDAIPWLEKSRASGEAPVEVLYMLGNCYIQAREPEKARLALAEMFGVSPGSAGAYLLTARMMVRQQFEDLAEKEAARAIELDSKIAGAHFLLGEMAIFRADLDRAIEELRKEIAVNPSFAMSWYRLGDAYMRREQWRDAIPCLQKAIWLNPDFSGPFILLGKAYLKQRDLVNAEGVLRRAVQMDTQNHSAHYLLGQTLMQAGRTDEAKKILERTKQLRKEAEP